MFSTNARSLWLRLWAPAVALLSVFAGESIAQSMSAAVTRNQQQVNPTPLEVYAFHSPQRAGAVPTMSLGVRYQLSERHVVFANASGVRGAMGMRDMHDLHDRGADPSAPDVTTKLGFEWKPAKATLGLERGAIGLQLDSGYRLSLRTRRGGAALYLRGKF